MQKRDDDRLIFARLDDLVESADKGMIVYSGFLSQRELRVSCDYLDRRGMSKRYLCFGGYREAERARIFFLPEYIPAGCRYEDIEPYLEKKPIEAIEIKGSGYRKLTHRDILGSLLALGIERDVLGDIAFEDECGYRAVVLCDSVIAEYIISELNRVANDAVKIKKKDLKNKLVI